MRLIDADAIPWFVEGVGDIPVVTEDEISAMPTVDAVKHGRWIKGYCNQCGEHAPYWPMASTYYRSNFCQTCGARMDGESE